MNAAFDNNKTGSIRYSTQMQPTIIKHFFYFSNYEITFLCLKSNNKIYTEIFFNK